MQRAERDGISVHHCTKCVGIWLDTATCTLLMTQAPQALLRIAHDLSWQKAEAAQLAADYELMCPECAEIMQKLDVGSAAVRIDACGIHGTWFDAGELTKVTRSMRRAIEKRTGGSIAHVATPSATGQRYTPQASAQAVTQQPTASADMSVDELATRSGDGLRRFAAFMHELLY
jgi:Zn-finger nucleic acid-binding protein